MSFDWTHFAAAFATMKTIVDRSRICDYYYGKEATGPGSVGTIIQYDGQAAIVDGLTVVDDTGVHSGMRSDVISEGAIYQIEKTVKPEEPDRGSWHYTIYDKIGPSRARVGDPRNRDERARKRDVRLPRDFWATWIPEIGTHLGSGVYGSRGWYWTVNATVGVRVAAIFAFGNMWMAQNPITNYEEDPSYHSRCDYGGSPPPRPEKPRTEAERMRDFFFPKRAGLMGLKSWK